MWKVITDNPLVSAIVAGLILAGLPWTIKKLKDKLDSYRIYIFIRDSEKKFRTTHAISSAKHIRELRVAELCGRDKRIKRNELEKQSWRIASEK